MVRVIPIVVVIALTVYCAVEVAQADAWSVRRAPKWLWAVAVICLPVVGSLAWLFLGRPAVVRDNPRRDLPPDDNPDFLRRI